MAERKQELISVTRESDAPDTAHQQERPQFHNLDDTYEDACDFGKFALNPCGCLLDSVIRCAPKIGKYLESHAQQIVYIIIVFGSWAVVFTKVYPLLKEPTIPSYHKNIGRLVFLSCVASWQIASNTCPGNITKANMAKYDNYHYDGWLYKDNNICPTLMIRKLARSKYDRHISRHVPRFDHYCGWIDMPVGEENYRVFILFLVVHMLMCTYGSVILWRLLSHMALQQSTVRNIVQHEILISLTLVIMIVMTGLLGGFLLFHLFLIANNTTTNEYHKWKDIKSWHEDATSKFTQQSASTRDGDEENSHGDFVTNPGPMPTNAYNMGCYANVHEVMFPRSLRRRNHQHVE